MRCLKRRLADHVWRIMTADERDPRAAGPGGQGDGVMTRRSQQYPPELRERAVRMVIEVTPNYDSQWAAISAVAQKLGVGTAETVRKWVRQAEIDAGHRPGTTSEESAECGGRTPSCAGPTKS
jgi:transposase